MALTVIGAGLGRTGTASIKVALERLGISPCYHMLELIENPQHLDFWMRAADGGVDWEELFVDYDGAVDQPACLYWKELSEVYPDAKVLLSVRDANRWFESTQETIFAPAFREHIRQTPFGHFLERVVWRDLAAGIDDRDFMTSYFEKHSQKVIDAIPSERLLIYEVKQGWGPLCEFLQASVPDEPFPHVNSREETKKVVETILKGSPGDMLETGQDYAKDVAHKSS